MNDLIIISRHPAAIEFIKQMIGDDVPVIEQATAIDVRGKHVYGNLPMHLAALAADVHLIEFSGPPPRGADYSIDEMMMAGAHISCYQVRRTL